MTFNPFSVLTSKIFGGVALAALIVCGLLYLNGQHYQKLYAQSQATLAQVKIAQTAADAAARKAIADKEAQYKEIANAADQNHAATAVAARTDADAYSAAHRVPACPSSAPRGTVASASSNGASVPAVLPSSAIVDDADVRACSGAAAYALEAHNWALTLANSEGNTK